MTTTSAFYGHSSEADAARPGRAGVELADEHDVAIRIDDLVLAGAHGERVLDRADLDVCDNELCAQRAGVVGPAVEGHRLLRRVDRSVRRRDHQAGTGGTAVGRRGGQDGLREHLAVDMAVPHLQTESGVERDRAMEVATCA